MFKRLSWKPITASVILLATAILFTQYFIHHPEVRSQLSAIDPATLAYLLILYVLFMGSLALVNSASLKICNAQINAGESFLLTAYSSIINFFGPLQSGPAFRALYLKKKYNVKLRDYTLASFVYYFFYALFSGMLLLSGILRWWLLPLALLVVAILIYFKNTQQRQLSKYKHLALHKWYYMALASLFQVILLVAIFYIELRSVYPSVQLSQVLVYTGAANFALFISITPGAIGFRESFLVFTQKLHNIGSDAIVAANTIDRAVYVSLLLILAVFIVTTHTKKRLTDVAGR